MNKIFCILTLPMLALSILLPCVVMADSWLPAEREFYFSSDQRFGFAVTPRAIRDSLSYFRDKSHNQYHPGQAEKGPVTCQGWFGVRDSGTTYRKLWERTLVNDVAPTHAIVADDGRYVVTFDNWYSEGYGDDVIVIYGDGGKLIRKFGLSDFLNPDEISQLPRSVSSISWGGTHWMDKEDGTLVLEIIVSSERFASDQKMFRSLRIDLATGRIITEPALYLILLGEIPVLHIVDKPGVLTSTAIPPPSKKPPTYHPFITASALHPAEESRLYELLLQSQSTRDYLTKLKDAGYIVRRE